MRKVRLFGILPILIGLLICAPNVSAVNPYGITYNGGVNLGGNNSVQADSELIDSLTPVITGEGDYNISFSDNGEIWKKGYFKNNESAPCRPTRYIVADEFVDTDKEVYYIMKQDKYSAKVDVKNIVTDGTVNANEGSYAVMVRPDGGVIRFVYEDLYSDVACTEHVSGVQAARFTDQNKYFIELKLQLFTEGKNGTKVATSDQLFFNIWDFDNGQSCQIRNKVNGVDVLSAENMYAKDLVNLQPTTDNIESGEMTDLRNKYVATGSGNYSYIYSEFDAETGKSFNINPNKGGNIYVKIDPAVQQEGIDLVFGFVHGAVSTAVKYYAKEYKVTYVSDENGKITGISKEDVVSGDNPSGSTQVPNDGYEFIYWIADSDVTLDDGTVIKKGEKLTDEQVLKVVVKHDIKFTAIHEPIKAEEEAVAVPDTGSAVGDLGTVIQILCIAFPAVIVAAALAKICYDRKKHTVNFEK